MYDASIYEKSIKLDSAFSKYAATCYLSFLRSLTDASILSTLISTFLPTLFNYSTLRFIKTILSLNGGKPNSDLFLLTVFVFGNKDASIFKRREYVTTIS